MTQAAEMRALTLGRRKINQIMAFKSREVILLPKPPSLGKGIFLVIYDADGSTAVERQRTDVKTVGWRLQSLRPQEIQPNDLIQIKLRF